jgi:radial spoke head protein 1
MAEYLVQYLDGEKEQLNWIKRRGKVQIQYPNEDVFMGTLNDARKKEGQGQYRWAPPNGEDENGSDARRPASYHGGYVNGLRSGIGRMTYWDGSEYNGQWKNGKMEGHGTMRYANKDTYSGLWANGGRLGHGAYVVAASGVQLVGMWQGNSIMRGKWVLGSASVFCGNFAENKPAGQGVFIHSNGLTQEGAFESKEETEDEMNIFFRGAIIDVDTLSTFKEVIAPVQDSEEQKNSYNIERKEVVVETPTTESGDISEPPPPSQNEVNQESSVPDSSTVSREEALLRKLFKEIDGNSDGKVDLCEMTKFLASDETGSEYDELVVKVPTLGSDETQQALKDIDSDGDGRLTLEELMVSVFSFVFLLVGCDNGYITSQFDIDQKPSRYIRSD